MSQISSLCVFCGAQNAVPKHFLEMGAYLGEQLAKRDIRLIYGGGDCGVMGAVANATMKAGGHAIGVFPRSLKNLENEHQSLTEIILVESMHERKMRMFDLADGFVVLPGGFGTMDETFEILTWKQLQFHHKPLVIVNYREYWTPLVQLMDNIISIGFAKPENAELYEVVTEVDDIFSKIL